MNFFMVRVAGLKGQAKAGFNKPENKAGLTPKQQLARISQENHRLVRMQYDTYRQKLLPELLEEKIRLVNILDITEAQHHYLERLFDENIYPVLTPMAIDAYHPFYMMLNKSINLAVSIGRNGEEGNKLAIVQVPAVLDRFIKLPNGEQNDCFILLEEVISHFIHKLFKGYVVRSISEFRITRNADLIIHEEGARDLLKEIENELKKQKWGEAIRLEITQNMDKDILRYLLNVLEIHKNDVYIVNGPLDLTFLFKFYGKLADEREHLIYESYIPRIPEALMENHTIFEVLSKKDILLHHPYDSFAPVIDFIVQAAEDPYVLAIKQTLYRVSGDSQIIEALKRAAENGKQVTVLVELKARFDEENNVQWARKLERAGCHVIYGVNNLKTHSKITLVVRQKEGKIERFVHLGTGNYNDMTAKIYTDMGLLTSNPEFGVDATDFFNYLSGYLEKPAFHHISTSPFDIREDLIQLIDREIDSHKKSGNGRIIAQMNSITDKSLIMKLYEASQAGVEIDLIVRGICCLRPGIKGVSETIRVRSIVGRFLEHKRIYYFYHDGKEQTYLSSADLMTRNMENRVEILFPICAPYLKQYVKRILDIILNDNVKARQQDHCGRYHYVERGHNEEVINSQKMLFNIAY